MSNITDVSIPRRKFLKGAFGALGASAIGFGPMAAFARLAPSRPLTLVYWDGSHFIPATRLASGDSTLKLARIGIQGYNSVGGTIKSIDAVFVVTTASGALKQAPYSAWIAPPAGAPSTRFLHHVDYQNSIGLKVQLHDSAGPATSNFTLFTGGGSVAKLKAGQYLLLDGTVNMNQFTFDAKNRTAPLSRVLGSGPVPQYLVLTDEKM